ncbi:transcription initiation factor TFIID subunit 2 [Drosophila grimshawi]|uniref:Transcription initiation factor TFIID subunit 2 n=1 Tax=Drosophila grimshawi TaxID=7222 RepID=B4JCM5_DROGR|nr:transcription initiation factor TFIID subunit 2 [Drosophila grimshawi]EDW04189.1 GH10122 [Drosophila grimshawi]
METQNDLPETPLRSFKLSHQVLSLTEISLEHRRIQGMVELTIVPNNDCLRIIRLNAKQLNIERVFLNDVCQAEFIYFDSFHNVCEMENRSLETYAKKHLMAAKITDPDLNNGELFIKVPPAGYAMIQAGLTLRIRIQFNFSNPKSGMHFVLRPPSASSSSAWKWAHMYTNCYENSSRLWFPCVDSYAAPCTWQLEFTVDKHFTAVSCGELVQVISSSDLSKKTFYYKLRTPVSAPNIALAVGPFEIYADPQITHEVTHFCLPGMLPWLKHTVQYLHGAFEFFEETLATRYPFASYKQVFVDELDRKISAYASMTIASVNLLHSKEIIDQTYSSRTKMARAVAEQFYGCFICPHRWSDTWLAKGVATYLCGLHSRQCFGNNPYREWVQLELSQVVKYEERYGGVILDCSQPVAAAAVPKFSHDHHQHHFPKESSHTVSPKYVKALRRKSHLVIRMLEHRIGQQMLFRVFNKQLALATNAAGTKIEAGLWSQLLISTNSFIKSIFTVTGSDMSLCMDQWVRTGGHVKFSVISVFNCKRNTIELDIRQDYIGKRGVRQYNGPLMVQLQELDGTFKHTLQIEDTLTRSVISCHSKSRRNKKKKIPLWTGEEIDMDLSAMDDSPVLWVRIDPEMILLRDLIVEQPDFQWQYQLRHERDVTAQFQAIRALERYATSATRSALEDTIENECCFYRVRCEAAHCLTKVANQMVDSWSGPPPMLDIFIKMFGSLQAPHIVRLNDFSNFQLYYLQKAIPVAMAGLRTLHGICPPDVVRFLLDLIKYNENSQNPYSDSYYRAALVTALGDTLSPGYQSLTTDSSSSISTDPKLVLSAVTRFLRGEHHLPSYKYMVLVACLKVIRRLQKLGHLPSLPHIFRSYSQYRSYLDLRLSAMECLVDLVQVHESGEDLEHLMHLLETDPDPAARYGLVQLLIDNPPFTRDSSNRLDQAELSERIWRNMNSLSRNTKLRCYMVDLYYELYVNERPNFWFPNMNHIMEDSSNSNSENEFVENGTKICGNPRTSIFEVSDNQLMKMEEENQQEEFQKTIKFAEIDSMKWVPSDNQAMDLQEKEKIAETEEQGYDYETEVDENSFPISDNYHKYDETYEVAKKKDWTKHKHQIDSYNHKNHKYKEDKERQQSYPPFLRL